ncbi:MAG: regulator of sigma protease [Acidobacteriota bacterium]|jgi:regulator of sigma E protease|nr:regulator of sigma protease [Acidobacteriota bacterium]
MHTFLTNFAGFVLVLGFLIFAHESGHFFAAKFFGVRVLVYSFGFGKRIAGFRRGDTDYRLSLIPLGGYVRMAGDMPEDQATLTSPADGVDAAPTGAPDEFLSKPKWQRFIILFAGPFMNLVIAVAFLAGISMYGTQTPIIGPVIGTVSPNKPAARAGLLPGDRIVRINGEAINEFDDLRLVISMHGGSLLHIDYVRNGVVRTTTLTPEKEESDYGPVGRAGVRPFVPVLVGEVRPATPAAAAGLRTGDLIVGMNGKPISQLDDLVPILQNAKGAPLALDVKRGETRFRTTLGAVKGLDPNDAFRGFDLPMKKTKLSLFPAIKDSVEQNVKMLKYTFITIGRLFRAEGSVKELSGPLSIARISGEMLRRGAMETIALMAMISLQLGFMNLLPIPVLDGGHIMVLLVEGIARRDLSLRVKERIQQVGFAALAALMIVVMYNDVIQNVLRFRKG